MASRSWNRVELIGNLTRDPELRFTPNGAAVCTFGIATNRTYVTDGEKKEEVDFHRLVAWNKLAELCNQLLKKGNRVFVSGRLQTRSWEDQSGQNKQTVEIVVEDMILLTSKGVGDYTGSDVDVDTPQSEPKSSSTPKAAPKKEEPVEQPAEQSDTTTQEAPKEELNDEDLPF